MFTRLRSSLQCVLLGAGLLAGCQTPTEVLLEVSTNAQCGDLRGTIITVGRLEEIDSRPPSAKTDSCAVATGRIGSLGILPRKGDSDEFAIRVVTGFYKTPEQCVQDGYVGGCIVARRVLGFVPNELLTLPVVMETNCIDVPCGLTETCRNGRCVSARIEDPEHCTDPAGCRAGGAGGGSGSGGSSAGGAAPVAAGGTQGDAGLGGQLGSGGVTAGNQGLGGVLEGGTAPTTGGTYVGGVGATTGGADITGAGGTTGGVGIGGSAGGTTGGVGIGGSAGGTTGGVGIGGSAGGTTGGVGTGGSAGGTTGGVGIGGSAGGTTGGVGTGGSTPASGGSTNCGGATPNDCNGTCTNIASDVNNCSACGSLCNPAHAVAACTSGTCQIATCLYGYANCDGSQGTGCETQLMDVASGLRGFWSLDEGAGSIARDGSSNPHDGALINMAPDAWTSGPMGGALRFDGLNDYVAIGNAGARIKTLSFWIRNDFVPILLADTGERAPTANGTPHHDWSNGGGAYANDGAYASATFLVLGNASHDWSAFAFNIPAGATILGIEAKIETKVSSISLGSYSVSLSWDGGNTFTSSKAIPSGLLGKSEQVQILGGSGDTWGHTWSVNEINNGFRLRADFTAIGLGTVYVDYITVRVSYRPYNGQKVIGVDGAAQIELAANELRATNFPGTTTYYIDGVAGTVLPSGWHHVAITNATGIDATSLELGKFGGGYFVGALDEIRAYDRVVPANEVAFLSGKASCP